MKFTIEIDDKQIEIMVLNLLKAKVTSITREELVKIIEPKINSEIERKVNSLAKVINLPYATNVAIKEEIKSLDIKTLVAREINIQVADLIKTIPKIT